MDGQTDEKQKAEKWYSAQEKRVDIVCPFCGEGDFDLIGLKEHLIYIWCESFQKVEI